MVNVQPTAAAPAVVKEVDISVHTPLSPLAGKRKGSDTMYQKAHLTPTNRPRLLQGSNLGGA